jgi:hypothetical protein
MFLMRDINYVGATAIVANLPRILNRCRGRRGARAEPDVFMVDCPLQLASPAAFGSGIAHPDRRLCVADRVGLAALAP